MLTEKTCSGCKTCKPIDDFYKNRSTKDGYSIYCVDCSKKNTERYHERKREKEKRRESATLINRFFTNETVNEVGVEMSHFMRLMVIENLCKSILVEIETMKKEYIKQEEFTA